MAPAVKPRNLAESRFIFIRGLPFKLEFLVLIIVFAAGIALFFLIAPGYRLRALTWDSGGRDRRHDQDQGDDMRQDRRDAQPEGAIRIFVASI